MWMGSELQSCKKLDDKLVRLIEGMYITVELTIRGYSRLGWDHVREFTAMTL